MVFNGFDYFCNYIMAYSEMKNKHLTLMLLALLFLIPVLGAYHLIKHPEWIQGQNPTNYGTFVEKPLVWHHDGDEKRPWQLVLWQNQACDKECLKQLDLLARIRLAMGRKVYLMNIWLFCSENVKLSAKDIQKLQQHDIHIAYASSKEEAQWNNVFVSQPIVLVTPEHKTLMMYGLNPNPKKMYHDFQLLIK